MRYLRRPRLIREPAREDLEEAGNRLRDPFDQTDDRLIDSEDAGEKEGNEGIDHLGADIHEETDQPRKEDIPAQTKKGPLFFHSGRLFPFGVLRPFCRQKTLDEHDSAEGQEDSDAPTPAQDIAPGTHET